MLRITLSLLIFATATLPAFAVDVIATDLDDGVLFGGSLTVADQLVATVVSIDAATRTVVLQETTGGTVQVTCGPEVRNFAQIEMGDTVTFTTGETVTVLVAGAAGTAAPAGAADATVARTPLGSKPGGVVATTISLRATVQAIDPEARLVTLKGPQKTLVVKVGDAPRFDRVQVGDAVLVEHRTATVITVTK